MGASGIHNDCMAYHALSMRGFPSDDPDPQLQRIFNEGHRIESFVVEQLRAAGHRVEEIDPTTGKQWAFTSHGGHHRAHLDGFITLLGWDMPMSLEIKSMNRASFSGFVKKGVRLSHPEYYDQCIDGLGLQWAHGGRVDRCLIVAYCKDTSKFHAEVVSFKEDHFAILMTKVVNVVVNLDSERKGVHQHEFDCKRCFKHTSCWTPNVEERHCSHCEWSKPVINRTWHCTLTNSPAPLSPCINFKLFRPEKNSGKK